MDNSAPLKREELTAELSRLGVAMRSPKMHGARALMDLDLTLPQLRAVFALSESEFMSMSPLAQELGITLSACTHMVDKLVAAGLVSRSEDPADRRVVRCSLTDKGQDVAEQLRQSMPFERAEFQDRLTVDELRVIVQAVSIFQRVMAEMQDDANAPVSGDVHHSNSAL
ncbi:MAG: MarR family transcriptional regulator [Dehalococcoidia bacterium]